MATAGGSHTNFDTTAFGAGAVGGSLALGAALVAGLANYRMAQQANYDAWTEQQLRAALKLSELLRARDQITMGREIQALALENERLKRDAKIALVRALPR
ncbi:hypothetical protein WHZ77_06020 [Bradyrhizobium sp. A5]|uniref:hypothetical protein n=1 Tax=Bradyrhizobium sp. A5 TaxID=3133696 RepID=UPI003254DE4B